MGGIMSSVKQSYGKTMKQQFQDKKVEVAVIGSVYEGYHQTIVSEKLQHLNQTFEEKRELLKQGHLVGDEEYDSNKMNAKVFNIGGRTWGHGSDWTESLEKSDAILFCFDTYTKGYLRQLKKYLEDGTLNKKPFLIIYTMDPDGERKSAERIKREFTLKEENDFFKVVVQKKDSTNQMTSDEALEWLTTSIALANAARWAEEEEKEEQLKKQSKMENISLSEHSTSKKLKNKKTTTTISVAA